MKTYTTVLFAGLFALGACTEASPEAQTEKNATSQTENSSASKAEQTQQLNNEPATAETFKKEAERVAELAEQSPERKALLKAKEKTAAWEKILANAKRAGEELKANPKASLSELMQQKAFSNTILGVIFGNKEFATFAKILEKARLNPYDLLSREDISLFVPLDGFLKARADRLFELASLYRKGDQKGLNDFLDAHIYPKNIIYKQIKNLDKIKMENGIAQPVLDNGGDEYLIGGGIVSTANMANFKTQSIYHIETFFEFEK